MPASATALTVVSAAGTPAGGAFNEQQSDASPGNKFANDGETYLYARNTNVAARTVTFHADRYGAERTVMTASVPGSATENGVLVMGPFPVDEFNDHSTTESATTGSVICSHDGADADIMFCPFKMPRKR